MNSFYPTVNRRNQNFAQKTIHPNSYFSKILLLVFLVSTFQLSAFSQGQALDFTNTGSNYVNLPNLLPSGSYTKEAWVNSRSFVGNTNNIVSGTTNAFWIPNGGNLSSGHNFSYITIQDPTPMVTGVWYHVAVTYDATTDIMSLYKNGVLVASGDADNVGGAPAYSETELYIGTYNNGGGPGGFLFDGQIDEVRIWNIVRTQAEIAASQSCILTGDEPGLLAYYNFDQGVAGGTNTGVTTLNDVSDRCVPNNGTLVGFTLSGATSNWVAPGAGISGSCGGSFPNINVTGNSTCINDGDGSPSTTDFTDFNGGLSRVFTIQNTGTATLTITNIILSGVNSSEFNISSTATPFTIAGGASATFTVNFSPSTVGAKSAIVNINSDDTDENLYDFNIAASATVLPITLKSFTVTKKSTQSQLNWVTASEQNNMGFDILKSTNGIQWTKIGFVAGSGNSGADISYTFTDLTPARGVNFYQLKQVDFDGKAKLSEVRKVTFVSDANIVYPVPTSDKIVLELKDAGLIGSTATIADWQGKTVQQITINKMQQEIPLLTLPSGMYILRLSDGTTHKLIKQ